MTNQVGIPAFTDNVTANDTCNTDIPSTISSTSLVDPLIHVITPPLTADQQQMLQQLRSELEQEPLYQQSAYLRAYCTDRTLHQFLRARNFDLVKSKKLLLAALEWRLNVKPDRILASETELEKNLSTGRMMVDGYDRHGRPIYIMNSGMLAPATSNETQIRSVFFQLERIRQKLQGNIEKYCLFINFVGYTFKSSPPFKVSLECNKTLVDRYVEHLGHGILWQPPTLFNALWTAVKPFLDAKTLSKIKFIKGDSSKGSENDRILTEIVGEDWREKLHIDRVLQAQGKPTHKYNHAQFWPTVVKEQQEWLEKNQIPDENTNQSTNNISTISETQNNTPTNSTNNI